MPTNLPEIKQLIADWYALAIDNPLFVGAIVIAVWVLAALLYNVKILFLKKKQKAAEKLQLEVQDKLTAAEKKNQQQEETLASNAEQMQKDQQLIAEIQDKGAERKQIIIANIRALASKFDLSEQLVGADEDMRDEFIWQQQDNVIQQLGDRLSAALQESAQAGEKDTLISDLQNSLELQIKQFAQLEQTIEAQKLVQQEQQKEIQQQLSNTLEKHQLDFTQLINAVQNRTPSPEVEPQTGNISEEPAQAEGQKTESIAEHQIVEFSAVDQVSTTDVDSQQEQTENPEPKNISEQPEPVEQDSANSIEPLLESEIEPVGEQDNLVQDLLNIAEPAFSTVPEEQAPQAETSTPDNAKSSLNVAGKFKSLLGKFKKTDTKAKAENSIETLASGEVNEESAKPPGKFKSLLGKAKKSRAKTEPEQKVATASTDVTKESEAEQQIETFIAEDYKEPEDIEEVHIEPDYGVSNFKMPGALKKLFGKAKK